MKPRYIILLGAIFFVWVGWMWMTLPEDAAAATPAKTEEQAVPETSPTVTEQQRAREQAAYEQQTRAYREELLAKEAAQKARAKTMEEAKSQRELLSYNRQVAWTTFISSNWTNYQSLRTQAAHSHNGQTPCTLCDGVGRMKFCILCDHSDGKCPTCRGTGRLSSQEICPTCFGTGKCYLCSGTGKMECPFCDDGVVYANGPLPSRQLPVR